MEVKEPNQLSTSAELNIVTSFEKNKSQGQGIYNVLFLPEQEEQDTTVDDKYSDNNREKPEFGDVSTLDWLKTWRSTQIS